MTDFEQAVLTQLGDIRAQVSGTAEKVASLDDRLFNGGAGIIPILQATITDIKSTAVAAASVALKLDTHLLQTETGLIPLIQQDIKRIETERSKEKRMDKIESVIQYSLAPILVGLHALLRRLGVNV